MVLNDLEMSDLRPMLAEGVGVLRKMLYLFANERSRDPQAREELVHEIASVFGSEQLTKRLLKRPNSQGSTGSHGCIPAPSGPHPMDTGNSTSAEAQQAWPVQGQPPLQEPTPIASAIRGDYSAASAEFQAALDMLSFDQWLDLLVPPAPSVNANY
ncbi:hypothetical protein KEM55_006635 [Ascosphaera atra]|nr:hypothetical protein KEM55_006635 [Ascosphaera atra]